MPVMTEDEIRVFLDEQIRGAGNSKDGRECIAARWLADREEAADEARNDIYEEQRDSWNGGE